MEVKITAENYQKFLSIYMEYVNKTFCYTNEKEEDRPAKLQRLFETVDIKDEKFLDKIKWASNSSTISWHALERFKERYPNISLDEDFYEIALNGIKQNAINRKGHIVKSPNKGIYRCIYKNNIIEYVLAYQKDNKFPIICTFSCPPKNIDDICYSYSKN